MTYISSEAMEKVTGGNAVIFSDGQPVCPICGAMGARMKVIEQTASYTAYQCELCHQVSTAETPKPETALTSCPVCGASGAAFRIIKDNGSTVRYHCMICNHEADSVK